MDDEDEVEHEAVARAYYEIVCPECGESLLEDHDPAGELIECSECEAQIRVTDTL